MLLEKSKDAMQAGYEMGSVVERESRGMTREEVICLKMRLERARCLSDRQMPKNAHSSDQSTLFELVSMIHE